MLELLQDFRPEDELIQTSWTKQAGISLYIRRFDRFHPFVSGNKPYKLSGWLKLHQKGQAIVSFGGVWSNHLLALAVMGKHAGIATIGIVRGERVSNPVIDIITEAGMQLHFVNRAAYRLKEKSREIASIIQQSGETLLVPEGGAGLPGVQGAALMVGHQEPYDWVILPGGTGTCTAGVAQKLSGSRATKILAFQALKGENILQHEVFQRSGIDLRQFPLLVINEDFHFGGFARFPEILQQFEKQWAHETSVFLDRVYGIKAMAGIKTKALNGFFKPGSRLLYLHTGGFTGIKS